METRLSIATKFHLPEGFLSSYYNDSLNPDFLHLRNEVEDGGISKGAIVPTLFAADLEQILDWLHVDELPKPFEKELCETPVLLYVSAFSTSHLLFHYDGSPASAELIKNFLILFKDLVKESKATIISPSFIPKSKIHEEHELINLVSQSTKETSFIKFNFSRIGDFWSYAVQHRCTLLVTSKSNHFELAKLLFHFYKGSLWSSTLSFYLAT